MLTPGKRGEKDEIPGLQIVDYRNNLIHMRLNQPPIIRPKLQNRQSSPFSVLLISQALIRSNKSFKPRFRFSQQVAIFQAIPSQPMRICALMESQVPAQRPRHTLIQQNPHAASKAASERSSTFTAKSFETEGKHSKNSSKV